MRIRIRIPFPYWDDSPEPIAIPDLICPKVPLQVPKFDATKPMQYSEETTYGNKPQIEKKESLRLP